MNEISQGLAISISGLSITFLALGVFILVMLLLQRFFPPKPEIDEDEEEGEVVAVVETAETHEDQEIAAAIAVAVSYFRSLGQSQLGGSLQEGRGPWWTSNRSSVHQTPRPRFNRSAK